MGFLRYHPRLGGLSGPDCTIFNYDTVYLLCEEGPVVYEHSIGGYIAPHLGGRVRDIDWYYFLKEIEELKPKIIVLPECYVNGNYPDFKAKVENEIKQLGYDEDQIWVYIQKEQNFYHGEIHVEPEWQYTDDVYYSNIIYHTIGHNVPATDQEIYAKFQSYKFCKQGFLCESFNKLYALRHSTPELQFEKRLQANIKLGELIFYGNQSTSNRPLIFEAIAHSKKLNAKHITYANEDLTDLVLANQGIGLSCDGLVFSTIRDTEFGIHATPSIKITRASHDLSDRNNIHMFRSRYWKQVPNTLVPSEETKLTFIKILEEAYEEYMDCVFKDRKKALRQIKYQFFITILQKFYNIELFLFDILFGDDLEEFIDTMPLNVDYSVFKKAAKPQYLQNNDRKKMCTGYIDQLLKLFDNRFKSRYDRFYRDIEVAAWPPKQNCGV